MSLGEIISHPLFLGLYVFFMATVLLLVFSFKYALFGTKAFFKKISGDFGLVFFRTANNDVKFPPVFANLTKTELEVKRSGVKSIYPYTRNQFKEGTFFGFPYCVKDYDDALRNYGLYAEVTKEVIDEETGQLIRVPLYHKVNNEITNIPVLTAEKSADTVQPEIIDGLISKNSILSSLRELFGKHNLGLVVSVVVGLLVLVSLYLGYENYTMLQQQLIPALQSMAQSSAAAATPTEIPLN